MLVRFYYAPVKVHNDDGGIPVYSDVAFVQITMDATTTVDRKARDADFERFPEQYAHFLKTQVGYEPIENEVPLEMWPMCTPADVQNLRARGVRTVEQLAKAKPELVKIMPPSVVSLVGSAKNYLTMAGSAAKTTALADKLINENNVLKEENAMLKAQIANLKAEKAEA
jgi:hypothetical protein